ncbi:MAG: SprT family zinc-dependent metalloprotease [Candidatus Andersenbacteria bacterium]
MKKKQPRESTVIIEGNLHPYTLRKSKKARNLLLHVNIRGEIEAVLPWYVSYGEAEAFVRERTQWLKTMLEKYRQLQAVLPQRQWKSGDELPYFGSTYILQIDLDTQRQRESVQEAEGVVTVRTNVLERVPILLMKWYRTQGREYFTGQAILYAAQLKKSVRSVRVLNTKTQWGSCNRQKAALTFQWRLALAPEEVARYVVAHEVAHLSHPNHSPAFWKCVKKLEPDFEQHRGWLRKHGHTLIL